MTATAEAAGLPEALGVTVIEGPQRVASELRWRVLDDGRPAVLGQLLPELARDASLRRRYVRDVERLATLAQACEGLARVRRCGPSPDPRALEADPPWRLRDDPAGETLDAWLRRRAPVPADEAAELVAALAERVFGLHARGAVLRDLDPRRVVLGEDGRPWLTDVGLARVDVLSTRSAASLILEGSPYAAPELLTRTVIDQRADLYGLGVLLFRALTGELPYVDSSAILRAPGPAPRVRARRAEVPAALDELVARCLAEDPSERPGSALELAEALRGRAALPGVHARVACNACGAPLRLGQRLCTSCGKLAVQFTPAASADEAYGIELTKLDERAESRARLHEVLRSVSDGPLPALNFLVGDIRLYSKGERERLHKLPARLVDGLSREGATRLQQRLRVKGIESHVATWVPGKRDLTGSERGWLILGGIVGGVATLIFGFAAGGLGGWAMAGAVALLTVVFLKLGAGALRNRDAARKTPSLVQLRKAPAALPASDPLVARLAALLQDHPPADLREQVGELALAVQRLVDHRARNLGEAAEIDVVTAPVSELVRLVEAQVRAIAEIDAELRGLDEGALVRALAAAEARRESTAAKDELLHGLDRLRALEDARARRFHRLLEATRLARRAVELGLSLRDSEAEHEQQVAAALAVLEAGDEEGDEGRPALADGVKYASKAIETLSRPPEDVPGPPEPL